MTLENCYYDLKMIYKSFFEIKNVVSKKLLDFEINGDVSINFSNIENVDLQINSIVRHKKNERFNELSKEIEKGLTELDIVEKCEVASQGFINIVLSSSFFSKYFSNKKVDLIASIKHEKRNLLLDYGGANIGKALHVGHIRTLNIGRSLANIYKLAGNTVMSDIHFGDWGMPVGLIIAYTEKNNIKLETLNPGDLEIIYPEASELSKQDENFYLDAQHISKKLNEQNTDYLKKWKLVYDVSTNNIKDLLSKLNFVFDIYKGESDVISLIPDFVKKLKEKKLIILDQEAFIANNNSEPASIIIKSDGAYVYLTTDLATVIDREANYEIDEYIYIVDQRQKSHFEQLFRLVEDFSLSKKQFTHVGFGTINDLHGKPLKTRDGGNYKLEDLYSDIREALIEKNNEAKNLEVLSQSVLTYSDLVTSRLSDYKFDLDKFTNINGKSAIYIQYSQVRAKKLLNSFNGAAKLQEIKEDEKLLVMDIIKFNYYFDLTIRNNEPHHLAEYLYGLCQKFNTFYKTNKIFSDENSDSEISHLIYIVESFYNTLLIVFECLGIDPVESM